MFDIYNGKKVLVCGGSGMVGRELSAMLLDNGAVVRVASLDEKERAPKGVEFIKADLTELKECLHVCEGMDFVFNLTGVKGSPVTARERTATYFELSVFMAMNILKAVRLSKVERFLFTSSVGVYAPAPVYCEDDVWETFPSDNDWGNGWGKRIGELHVEAYRREFSMNNICIVRPANVYGPYDSFTPDCMVVPALIRRACGGENPLVVWGDGSPIRDFIFCRDVARGMMIMMEKMPDKPVNLGSGTGVTIKEVAEVVCKHVDPSIKITFDASKPLGDLKRLMSTERAESYGFRSEISFDDGIRETVEWYRNNSDIAENRYNVFDTKI
jgi:GDP-L-fucose synthase